MRTHTFVHTWTHMRLPEKYEIVIVVCEIERTIGQIRFGCIEWVCFYY